MQPPPAPYAYFPDPGGDPALGLLATGLAEVSHDPAALDRPGWWAAVGEFDGRWTCARFTDLRPAALPRGAWTGPAADSWRSSLDQRQYQSGVQAIRRHIATGAVYQVNLCRVLSAPLDAPGPATQAGEPNSPAGLARRLVRGNPAPYAGVIDLPGHGVRVVSASPELFLRRDGDLVASSPIKGTGRSEADLLPKDTAENVMIVDLVRNDLARVARTGTVAVTDLCAVEKHPGLVHLVSTVTARLRPGTTWPQLLDATFPPGSVSGAPKLSALRVIRELEPARRGPYCGAFGWVHNTSGAAGRARAQLAVGIRTFWIDTEDPGHGSGPGGEPRPGAQMRTWLRFGTGAGITWGSDPLGEWRETELKAARLIALASRPSGGG
ncbi:MAG TPA: anthranilate synthase component I family protein [Actinocrinis sp.]|nr:anthranilate synthase component I family protein [Actinocrinis sp.]